MLFGNLNAFGPEVDFAYPPKPAGKAVWNIDWTAKARFRSHSSLLIGADFGGGSGNAASAPREKKKKKCKRSEESRGGKECVSTGKSRWSADHYTTKNDKIDTTK